jgi:hypothetical protein
VVKQLQLMVESAIAHEAELIYTLTTHPINPYAVRQPPTLSAVHMPWSHTRRYARSNPQDDIYYRP